MNALLRSLALFALLLPASLVASSKAPPLGVGYPGKSVTEYDPALVETARDSKHVRWLFSKLIDYGEDGELEGLLAESWAVRGETLFFGLKKTAKTVDGRLITAEDVAFSLKRLMVLGKGGGTHTQLDARLCGGPIKTVSSPCPGIVLKDAWHLELKPNNDPRSLMWDFVRSDLAIVPRGSVDPKTLKITDHRNTSGAYYFEGKSADGVQRLRANPNWPLYSKEMPQEILFQSPPAKDEYPNDKSVRLFKEGQINFIDTGLPRQLKMELAKAVPGAQLLEHQVRQESYVMLTPAARKTLSVARRQAIQVSLQKMAEDFVEPATRREAARTFFLPLSWGALDSASEEKYQALLKTTKPDDGEGLSISVRDVDWKSMKPMLEKHFPKMKAVVSKYGDEGWDAFAGKRDDIHFVIQSTDISPNSDDGDFVYHVKLKVFSIDDTDAFVRNYVTLPVEKRKEVMAKEHYRALVEDPVLFPLFRFPMFVLLREPWTVESRFWLENPYRFRLKK